MKKGRTMTLFLCTFLLTIALAGCSSGWTTYVSTDSVENFQDTTITVDVTEVDIDDDLTAICFKEDGTGYFAEVTDDTELTDADGNTISIDDIGEGDSVTITTDEEGYAVLIVLNAD